MSHRRRQMDKSAFFFDNSDTKCIELRLKSHSGGRVKLLIRYEVDGKQQWSNTVTASDEELSHLAKWLEDFWDESAPVELAGQRLRFVYAHREQTGDGYYDIEFIRTVFFFFKLRFTLRVYEQLGTSNSARAEQVRGLLSI